MRRLGYRVGLAIALGMAIVGAARAEVSADQAAGVQRDLRGWIVGLLSPLVAAGEIPLTVSPAGERYRMEFGGVTLPGFTLAADGGTRGFLRPQGDGRWVVEELMFPARFDLSIGEDKASVFALRLGTQSARMEIDTTLASPTRMEAQYGEVEQTMKSAAGSSMTRMAKVTITNRLEPGADGRMMAASESRITGYDMQETAADGSLTTLKAREISATSHVEGLSMQNWGAILRGVSRLAADIKAGPVPDGGPTAAQREMLHALLDTAGDWFASARTEQIWSGSSLTAAGIEGSLARVKFGSAIGAPAGQAEFGLRFELEGLASPMIPPAGIGQLVPKRLVLAPRVSGVRKEEAMALLSRAIDTAGDDDADMAGAVLELLADQPAVVTLDTIDIEVGGARLRGTGSARVSSPSEVSGKAELRMTGLDALMRTVAKVPEAAMAGPVLLMLKGLGEQNGAETVWRVSYAANKMMVNGQDVSALMAGAK